MAEVSSNFQAQNGDFRPAPISIRVGVVKRDEQNFPRVDEELMHALYAKVEGALGREDGLLPRPAVVGLGEDQVFFYDVLPLFQGGRDVHRFTGAVAGQDGVEAVATMGVVRFGPQGSQRLAAMVFIEWPDGRWCSALRPLDEQRKLRDEWPVVTRTAVEGYPRPNGVGGWFSRARREGLKLRGAPKAAPQPGSGLVH